METERERERVSEREAKRNIQRDIVQYTEGQRAKYIYIDPV
jgi:hypothetical protein